MLSQLPGKTIAHLATESRRPFLLPDWVCFLSTFLTVTVQYRIQPGMLSPLLVPTLESHTSLLASPQQAAQLPCSHTSRPHPEPMAHLLVGTCSRAVLTETLCSLSVQLMSLMKLQHPNISLYHEMFIMWNNEVGWSTYSPAADRTGH